MFVPPFQRVRQIMTSEQAGAEWYSGVQASLNIATGSNAMG